MELRCNGKMNRTEQDRRSTTFYILAVYYTQKHCPSLDALIISTALRRTTSPNGGLSAHALNAGRAGETASQRLRPSGSAQSSVVGKAGEQATVGGNAACLPG